jgi:hypothetical protein
MHSNNRLGAVYARNQAGYLETSDDHLLTENSNSSAPLICGDFESDILKIYGNFQIDHPSGIGYELPTTDGSVNNMLQTRRGTVSWTDPATVTKPVTIDSDGNTTVDVEESTNEDKIRIDVGGARYW